MTTNTFTAPPHLDKRKVQAELYPPLSCTDDVSQIVSLKYAMIHASIGGAICPMVNRARGSFEKFLKNLEGEETLTKKQKNELRDATRICVFFLICDI